MRAAKEASALALIRAARAWAGAQLTMSYERWTERYIDVLAEAIVRARAEGTLSLCSEPLAESMRDLALGQRSETALSMWDALVHRLEIGAPDDPEPCAT
ncbi:MAG: hypothetical protein R3F14_25275 [Polyangiaceae bacterium]